MKISLNGWRGLWSSAPFKVDVAWRHQKPLCSRAPANRGSPNKLCLSIEVRHAADWMSLKFNRDPTRYILWPPEGFWKYMTLCLCFLFIYRPSDEEIDGSTSAPCLLIVCDPRCPDLNPRRRSDVFKDSWQTNAVLFFTRWVFACCVIRNLCQMSAEESCFLFYLDQRATLSSSKSDRLLSA